MDTKTQKLLQALTLLYHKCEPLSWDFINTAEEAKKINDDIAYMTIYCTHVFGAIEDGIEPLSFDDWDSKADAFEVTAKANVYINKDGSTKPDTNSSEITNLVNDSFKVKER